jgi:integrase/recombinase XerD
MQSTVPAILANAGENAATNFLEFFAARPGTLNTREAYAWACAQFLAWSENYVDDIRLITPMHVAAYIEQHPGSPQTISWPLAAVVSICMNFAFMGGLFAVTQKIRVQSA